MKALFTLLANRLQAGAIPSHDRSAKKLRTVRTVRALLLFQIAMFLVLATIHFGVLISGYRHAAAGVTESLIAVLLIFGLLLTWTPPPWSQRAATTAESFGTLGVLLGLSTSALGIGPQTALDLSFNVVLLLTLSTGLALLKRSGARAAGMDGWMSQVGTAASATDVGLGG